MLNNKTYLLKFYYKNFFNPLNSTVLNKISNKFFNSSFLTSGKYLTLHVWFAFLEIWDKYYKSHIRSFDVEDYGSK